MPMRPGKACRVNSCANIVKDTKYQGYCESHKDKSGWFANEKLKGNRHQRGYGKHWEQLRTQALRRDSYLCQSCKAKGKFTKGNQVDHIKPKSNGGTDNLSNLQTLCVDCHNIKTATE